jgi:hypothetical protein
MKLWRNKIMNLFKKALLASAVAASFGASATATVSSTPLSLSAEGIAAGETADDVRLTFDVVVGTLHPAASTITLTFDSEVDLDDLAGGAVINDPAEGQGRATDVTFDYGTGSFTFDNVTIVNNDNAKGEQDSISFDVNLGNPVTANSAFRIILGDSTGLVAGAVAGGTNKVDITGEADVAYSSMSGLTTIETGSGEVAKEVSQLSFSVSTKLNKIIDREDNTLFTDATVADTLSFTLTNDETLAAPLTVLDLDVLVAGDFSNVVAGDLDLTTGAAAPAINGDEDEITFNLTAVEVTDNGDTDDDLLYAKVGGAIAIPATGSVTVTATVDDDAGTDALGADGLVVANAVDGGEWALDATVINVPYFPVGFEGVSSSVHFANETDNPADIIVSAIDGEGNEYGPLDLGSDLAANTVTKVSQSAIMSLFSLTESTKLSVTFNIDADKGDVNAHALTSSDTGRTEVATSQQNNDAQ